MADNPFELSEYEQIASQYDPVPAAPAVSDEAAEAIRNWVTPGVREPVTNSGGQAHAAPTTGPVAAPPPLPPEVKSELQAQQQGTVTLPPTEVSASPSRSGGPGLPPEYAPQFGGQYYPDGDEYLSELEGLRLAGDISDAQYQQLRGKYEQHANSSYGIGVGIERANIERLGLQGQRAQRQIAIEEQAEAERRATMAGYMRQQAARQKQSDKRQRELNAHVEKAFADYRAAQQEANSFEIGDKRDTGTRVLDGIAAALGAMGAALAKTPNFAMQMIEGRLQRELDAQKAQLSSKRAAVGERANLLQLYRQRLGDHAAAEEAWRADMSRRLGQRMQLIGSQSGSAQRQEAFQAIAQDAEFQAEQAEQRLKLLGATRWEKIQQLRAAAAQPKLALPEGVLSKPLSAELEARYVPGFNGFARTSDEAKKLRGKASTMAEMEALTEEMLRLYKHPEANAPGSKVQGRLFTMGKRMQVLTSSAEGAGVIREHEEAAWNKMIPTSKTWAARAGVQEQLGAAEQNLAIIKMRREAASRNSGIIPGWVDETSVDPKTGKESARAYIVEPARDVQERRIRGAYGLSGRKVPGDE